MPIPIGLTALDSPELFSPEAGAAMDVQTIGVIARSPMFNRERDFTHLFLGAYCGRLGQTAGQAGQLGEIKPILEGTSYIDRSIVGRIPPADETAILGKSGGIDCSALSLESGQNLAGVSMPEQNFFLVSTATGHPLPAGMKGCGNHRIVVTGKHALLLATGIGIQGELFGFGWRQISSQQQLPIR
jgi:hypothetical protein